MKRTAFRDPATVDPGEPEGFPPRPPVVAVDELARRRLQEDLHRAAQDFHAAVVAPRERKRRVAIVVLALVAAFGVAFLLAFCGAHL